VVTYGINAGATVCLHVIDDGDGGTGGYIVEVDFP
jgi:hypothetical protein